jgi:hypothetical protein
MLRTRSYNMSQSINGLGGQESDTWWIPSYQRSAEIRDPDPSKLFVFIDVHEDGILDARSEFRGQVARMKVFGLISRRTDTDRLLACLSQMDMRSFGVGESQSCSGNSGRPCYRTSSLTTAACSRG